MEIKKFAKGVLTLTVALGTVICPGINTPESIPAHASAEKTEEELKNALEKSSSDTLEHWVYRDFDGNGTLEGYGAFMNENYELTEVRFINSEGEITLIGNYGISFIQQGDEGYTVVTEEDKSFVGFDTGSGAGYVTYVFGVKDDKPYELSISGTLERLMQSPYGSVYTYESLMNFGENAIITLDYDSNAQEFYFPQSNIPSEEDDMKYWLLEFTSEKFGEQYIIEKWIYDDFNGDGKKEAVAIITDEATQTVTKGCYVYSDGSYEIKVESPNHDQMNDVEVLPGINKDEACAFVCFKGYHWGHPITYIFNMWHDGRLWETKILMYENGEFKELSQNGYLEEKDGKYYWHCVEEGPTETAVYELWYDYNHSALYVKDDEKVNTESDWSYSENPDGTLTITSYTGSESELTIPSEIDGKKVTAIGELIFDFYNGGNQTVKKLTIPGSIKTIGEAAFAGAYGLEEVIIEDGVETIGGAAFGSCNNLKKITIPSSVTEIGNFVFCWAYASDSPAVINVEIHCYKDSAAYDYAIGNNSENHVYKYVLLDGEPNNIDSSEPDSSNIETPAVSENTAPSSIVSSEKNSSAGPAKTDNPNTGSVIGAGLGIAVLIGAALTVKHKSVGK